MIVEHWESDEREEQNIDVNAVTNVEYDFKHQQNEISEKSDDMKSANDTVQEKSNEILDYNDYEDYYYDDSYYEYKGESALTKANSSTEKPVERPVGIIEDKIDVEDIQVIEIKLRKNKKNKKQRHKKIEKDKIKKVKIHTGADAIKVLNKITKKANKKKKTEKDRKISVTKTESFIPIYKWAIGTWSEVSVCRIKDLFTSSASLNWNTFL